VGQEDIIKSISYDQTEIIRNIIELYCPNGIELDPTFSKGNFYKDITKPKYCYDLYPQTDGVIQSDCRHLPHSNASIKSIMFDPPFVGGKDRKGKGYISGIIRKRFGFYSNVQHKLWDMYHGALVEFYRILVPNGILIFKCQDTVDSGKQCLSHVEIINYAYLVGFYPKDIFVLLAKNRLIGIHHHKQQHCRKYHSYFLVFIKQKSPVKYSMKLKKPKMESELDYKKYLEDMQNEAKPEIQPKPESKTEGCCMAEQCTFKDTNGNCSGKGLKLRCKDRKVP